MVKKLMLVTSILALSGSFIEAMETPAKENQDRTPGAPQKKMRFITQAGNDRAIRTLDFNDLSDDTEDY